MRTAASSISSSLKNDSKIDQLGENGTWDKQWVFFSLSHFIPELEIQTCDSKI